MGKNKKSKKSSKQGKKGKGRVSENFAKTQVAQYLESQSSRSIEGPRTLMQDHQQGDLQLYKWLEGLKEQGHISLPKSSLMYVGPGNGADYVLVSPQELLVIGRTNGAGLNLLVEQSEFLVTMYRDQMHGTRNHRVQWVGVDQDTGDITTESKEFKKFGGSVPSEPLEIQVAYQ